jgi:hypothetical protein
MEIEVIKYSIIINYFIIIIIVNFLKNINDYNSHMKIF